MHYIRLITFEYLDRNSCLIWKNTIAEFAPTDALKKDIKLIKTRNKDTGEFIHTIELSRHLYNFETEFIVRAWEAQYAYDFDIETSEEYDSTRPISEYFISKDAIKIIQEQASKFLHNRWVEDKTQAGWRYGLRYNLNEQTNPKLMNWDNLPVSYRRTIELTEKQAFSFYVKNRHLFN